MNIRHLFAALFATVLLFSLSGCNEKEQSKTFSWSAPGTELTLTYYYKDDKVLRQTAKNKIAYSAIGASSKEDAMKLLEPVSKKYQSVKGIKESVDYQQTYAQETLDVDYSAVNFAELNALQGTAFSGTPQDGISMQKSEALLKAKGFKEVQ